MQGEEGARVPGSRVDWLNDGNSSLFPDNDEANQVHRSLFDLDWFEEEDVSWINSLR